MRDLVKKLSNERLEDEIANAYYVQDGKSREKLLGLLWAEFDRRYAAETIEHEPMTGDEELDD